MFLINLTSTTLFHESVIEFIEVIIYWKQTTCSSFG